MLRGEEHNFKDTEKADLQTAAEPETRRSHKALYLAALLEGGGGEAEIAKYSSSLFMSDHFHVWTPVVLVSITGSRRPSGPWAQRMRKEPSADFN